MLPPHCAVIVIYEHLMTYQHIYAKIINLFSGIHSRPNRFKLGNSFCLLVTQSILYMVTVTYKTIDHEGVRIQNRVIWMIWVAYLSKIKKSKQPCFYKVKLSYHKLQRYKMNNWQWVLLTLRCHVISVACVWLYK